jgi:hypothetical protein
MAYGTLKADVIQSDTAGTPPQFRDGNSTQIGTLCRAWVNFDGTNGSIRASFNVSSVTRASTGTYAVAFTTALTDANYAVSLMSSVATSGSNGTGNQLLESTTPTTSGFTWNNYKVGTGVYDPLYAHVSVFR